MPMGTPPKGRETSAAAAAARARVGVEVGEGVELAGLDGGERGLELLDRRALPGPERVDQRAGVSEPGRVSHGADSTGDAPRTRTGRGPPVGSDADGRPGVPRPASRRTTRTAGTCRSCPASATGHGVPVRRLRARRGDRGAGGHDRRPLVWATAQYLSYASPPSVMDIDVTIAGRRPATSPRPGRSATSADREILTVNAALGHARHRRRPARGRRRPTCRRPTTCRAAHVPRLTSRTRSWAASTCGWPRRRDCDELDGRAVGRRRVGAVGPHPRAARDVGRRRSPSSATTCRSASARRSGARPAATASTTRCASARLVPTEWVLLDIRIDAVANGFGHGVVHLWAEDGTLMATASQSTIVRYWRPRPGRHRGRRGDADATALTRSSRCSATA